MTHEKLVGAVQALWQYPVKSMQGIELEAGLLTEAGLLGDRAHALVDLTDGTVASAKNPRKWPSLLDGRAEYLSPPQAGYALPALRIVLPDGSTIGSDQPEVHRVLSAAFGRAVELRTSAPPAAVLQQLWQTEAGEHVTDERMPEGTFFDLGPLHLLTTSTIEELSGLRPASDFQLRRFRPNVLVAASPELHGFAEQAWLGRTLLVGESVRLRVNVPTARCIMTTLAQPGLGADAEILRTVARHGKGNVGVYAVVIKGGVVRRGDPVWLEGAARPGGP